VCAYVGERERDRQRERERKRERKRESFLSNPLVFRIQIRAHCLCAVLPMLSSVFKSMTEPLRSALCISSPRFI
jgi:hypothetical protein